MRVCSGCVQLDYSLSPLLTDFFFFGQLQETAAEREQELAVLKEAVFDKINLMYPPNPTTLSPTRAELVASIIDEVRMKIYPWVEEEFEKMFHELRSKSDKTIESVQAATAPAIEMLDACLRMWGVDPASVPPPIERIFE